MHRPSASTIKVLKPQNFYDAKGGETKHKKIPAKSGMLAWRIIRDPTKMWKFVRVERKLPVSSIFGACTDDGIEHETAASCLQRGIFLLVSKKKVDLNQHIHTLSVACSVE